MKRIIIPKGISFFFTLMALMFSAAMLVTYIKTGISTFTPVLSENVIIFLWICISCSALLSVFEVKNLKFILYLLIFWSWLQYLVSEASYISNVMVGIDGNTFGSGFIMTTLFGLFAWVCALISAIVQKRELGLGRESTV